MDKKLEKIYLEELENTVISKFQEKGFEVSKCEIDAILDTTKKNAGIHSITVKVKNSNNDEDFSEIKEEIATEFEIEVDKINIKK